MEPPKYPETITQPSNSVSADKIAKSHTLQIKWDQLFRLIPFCPCPLGKRQQGYLIGDSQKPTATEHDCLTWESENSMVISWLGSSRKKFGTLPRLFFQILSMFLSPFVWQSELKEKRQGDSSTTDYYHTLISLQQGLELFDDNTDLPGFCA